MRGRRPAVLITATVLALSFLPAVPAAAAATCAGLAATITGTPGDDTIDGTDGADVIVGYGGDDQIRANGGDDTVCGGQGDDDLRGGDGHDEVFGGAGLDTCRAESTARCEGMPLEPGDSGRAVAKLQSALKSKALFGGEVNGAYGASTVSAVVAFHKLLERERTGSWLASDWERLADFTPEVPTRRPREPNRIEIDIGHQVLFLIENDEVAAIAPVSTGGGYTYVNRFGHPATAHTPRGDFNLRWYGRGWRCDPVTTWCVYDYWSFSTYYGIHGYRTVPTYPASHGCVRLNTWDSDRLTPHFYVGMPVHIWDTAP